MLEYIAIVTVLSVLYNIYFYRKAINKYKFNRSFKVKAYSFSTLVVMTALLWPITLIMKLIGRHGNEESLIMVAFADLSFVIAFEGKAYLKGSQHELVFLALDIESYDDPDMNKIGEKLRALADSLYD